VAYTRSNRKFSLIVDAATGSEEEKGGRGAILCQTDERGELNLFHAHAKLCQFVKKLQPFLVENASCLLGNGSLQNISERSKVHSLHRPQTT
jgi:hypothetical protein